MSYLSVSVFKDNDPRMSQVIADEINAFGVQLYIEHPHGPTTEEDLNNSGRPCVVLELRTKPGYEYFVFEGEKPMAQAQGIFIYACDSRYREQHGHKPIPLHVHESFTFADYCE